MDFLVLKINQFNKPSSPVYRQEDQDVRFFVPYHEKSASTAIVSS